MTNFIRNRFTSFDGTPISYLDSGTGTGQSVALLLHGFLADAESNFGPADRMIALMERMAPPGALPLAVEVDPAGRAGVAARLAKAGFRVLVPDMRGHGQSGKPDTVEAYHHRAMAKDMIGLLDELGVERCSVLGYSMGSATTAHLIAEAPERIQSAILGGIGVWIVAGETMELPAEYPIPESVPRPLTFAAFSEYAAAILDGSAPPVGFGAMYSVLADQLGFDRQVAAAVLRGQLADPVAPASFRAFERRVMVLNGDQDLVAWNREEAFGNYLPQVSFTRCKGDHLGAALDPGFQSAVVRHFAAADQLGA